MDSFSRWEDVPEHLATKTQLGRQGLKLAAGQEPVAKKTGGYGPYDLYDRRAAVPKRATTEAQKAAARRNLEKARAALRCADCNAYGETLDENGRCSSCSWRHYITEESRKARTRLAALAAADDWLIVDTETTGLDDTAEIIQIGIVDATGRALLSQTVRPQGDIDPEATAVNGLDAVAGAPTWPDIYPDVTNLVNGRLVLAYNADFDERMIRQTCALHELDVPAVSGWVCVMELFAAYAGEWSNYHSWFKYHSLVSAVHSLDIRPHEAERYRPHDAAGDAWLTWRLVQAFAEEANLIR